MLGGYFILPHPVVTDVLLIVFSSQVICGKCSSKRAPLAYLEDRKERVCTECYTKIEPDTPVVCDIVLSPPVDEKPQRRRAPVFLQVALFYTVFQKKKNCFDFFV